MQKMSCNHACYKPKITTNATGTISYITTVCILNTYTFTKIKVNMVFKDT